MQLAELLAQIDELKSEIDKLRPLKPEVERRIMQKFRLDWNYHSNAIEGNTLTFGETRAFLMEGLTANGKPLKDHLDIKGHNELLDFLEQFIRQKERLTEAAIREMHKILLKEPYQVDAITSDGRIVKKTVHLGEYKQEQNCVRTATGEIHEYARPEEVTSKMAELLRWYEQKEADQDDHPLIVAAAFHHKFLAIHPFDDGNGRMGRILMNLILMKKGFPPAIVQLKLRESYVASLRKADVGELAGITVFIGESLLDSMTLYLRGANGENIEDMDDIDKAIALLKQELKNAPTPIEISLKLQLEHFEKQLFPLLHKVGTKLSQFNELFSSSRIQVSYNSGMMQGPAVNGNAHYKDTSELIEKIRIRNQSKKLYHRIQVTFTWNNFLKECPREFSPITGFSIVYQKRKMIVDFNAAKLLRTMEYDEWLNEEEENAIISGLAKTVLEQIKRGISSKE